MDRVRSLFVAIAVASTVAACSGSAAAPSSAPVASASPSASTGPSVPATVTTKEQAVDAVIATEPRFVGITEKNPDMIGQASWFEVKPASGVGAFIVTMRVGWGDCPAGCIDQHVWTYAVQPDGTVNLQNQTGSDPPANAWPASGGGGGEGS